jgi:hypothetical protein
MSATLVYTVPESRQMVSSRAGLEQSNCKHALTRQGKRIKNIAGIFFNGAHTVDNSELSRKQNNSRKNE